MKRIASLLLAFFFLAGLSAQKLPPPREVPREYRPEYRDLRREARQITRELERKDFDIILDPIEMVPVERSIGVQDFTNWGYQLLAAEVAERIQNECKYPVVLDICDTGAQSDHPDLAGMRTPKRNYSSDGGLPDLQGHATHCAGIAFGRGGGIAYALWDAGLLRPKMTKILSDRGTASFAQIANMQNGELPWYEEQIRGGAYVVQSWSFGGGNPKQGPVEEALAKSEAAGVLTVAAAGNNGGAISYPGNSPHTFCVGALDEALKRASFSSYGEDLHTVAPGVRINSTYLNGSYAKLSGTSMATPMVAGVAAIAFSKWGPKLGTPQRARQYLQVIATDLGAPDRDDEYGWGLTYARAVLDNDPDDVLGGNPEPDPQPEPEPDPQPDPQPEPGPTPEPEPINTYTVSFDRHYSMLWGKEFRDFQQITVTEVVLTHRGQAPVTMLFALLDEFYPTYYRNRAVVGPSLNVYEAARWTGIFLPIIAEQKAGLDVEIQSLKATDGTGAEFIVTDFSRQNSLNADEPHIFNFENN